MLTPRPSSTAATLAALALALGACGEDREGSVSGTTVTSATTGAETTARTAPAPTGRAVDTVNVSETEFRLDPANPTVEAGIVEFRVRNDGQVVHALEVEGPTGEVETDQIQPGESATLKADLSKPGTYVWYCPVGDHKDRGMEGEITVGGGGGGGARTATTETTETESGGGGGGYGP